MVGQKTLITDLRMGVGSVSKREGARVCARARQSDLNGLKDCVTKVCIHKARG